MMMTNRILVIDDELFARRLLEMIFERNGYQVLLAGSAQEGLELLNEWDVAAITCDLVMPDMGGLQFLEHLRADPRFEDIPIIMITAVGTQEELEKAQEQGATGMLIKPFSERQIIQMVQGMIEDEQPG